LKGSRAAQAGLIAQAQASIAQNATFRIEKTLRTTRRRVITDKNAGPGRSLRRSRMDRYRQFWGGPTMGSSSPRISPRVGFRPSFALLNRSCPSRLTSKRPLVPALSPTSSITGAQYPRISAAKLTAWSK